MFFRRPDGKALPHCGYQLDDWVDESSDKHPKNSREFFPDLSLSENSMSEHSGDYYSTLYGIAVPSATSVGGLMSNYEAGFNSYNMVARDKIELSTRGFSV